MSQIFEALRRAQQPRTIAGMDRRRSARRSLCVPVFVYGYESGQMPFHEQTYLQQVSEDGGLLTLSTGVRHGQKLLLTSGLTQLDQKCFVVHARARNARCIEVGIEFAQPCPQFLPARDSKR